MTKTKLGTFFSKDSHTMKLCVFHTIPKKYSKHNLLLEFKGLNCFFSFHIYLSIMCAGFCFLFHTYVTPVKP